MFVGVHYPKFRSFGVFACCAYDFFVSGNVIKNVTTRFPVVSARYLPLMSVCPLILCSIMGRPSLILYWSVVTMAAIRGLWW